MEISVNISTQTNENIENFKKAIADTSHQVKKINENLNQLWSTANKTLQLVEENQQKLVSIKENNKTLKTDIKNETKVKGSIIRDYKEQTEEMHKHMNKLKDENEDLRNRSLRSTLVFRGVAENEENDAWEDVSQQLVSLLSSRLNLNYDELQLPLSRTHRTPKTTEDSVLDQFLLYLSTGVLQSILKK